MSGRVGRPAKTLAEHVVEGTFRPSRHWRMLAGDDLPWAGFAGLQRRFRAASSDAERRQIALQFEHAVREVHSQAAEAGAVPGAAGLQAALEELGRPGSTKQLLGFFPELLCHTKGPMVGEPFRLEPWQRSFLREFYRRDRKGRRVYRLGLLGLPRGNAKTSLAAGLALYELVSRTDAPEIYLAAASREQARICLSFARDMAAQGPLAQWVSGRQRLTCPASRGSLQAISSEGVLQHGLAPAAAIVDELWAFQHRAQRETYEALSTALHKRENAYLLAISTAGYQNSLLGQIYQEAVGYPDLTLSRHGCLTVAKNPEAGVLLWWYGVPAGADIEDRKLWRAANPASWIRLRDLERHRQDPGLNELDFRRLHLSQPVGERHQWLPLDLWASLEDEQTIPTKADVYVGVDVGLRHDTTAVAWAHRLADGRIVVRARVWAADAKAEAHVYTGGDDVQLEQVEAFIRRLAATFRVREVAFDPRFFKRSAELLALERFTLVEFLQASAPMADAVQRFYQLASDHQLLHNGDPVLAAHIAATAARPTERGWKLSKQRSSRHIDATHAAVMAVGRADLAGKPRPKPQIHWVPANWFDP